MKTRTGVLLSLLLLVAAVALITGSCENSLNLSGYYIYAELDGTAYEWKLGATIIADDDWVLWGQVLSQTQRF